MRPPHIYIPFLLPEGHETLSADKPVGTVCVRRRVSAAKMFFPYMSVRAGLWQKMVVFSFILLRRGASKNKSLPIH
jgi:hypothetical protein